MFIILNSPPLFNLQRAVESNHIHLDTEGLASLSGFPSPKSRYEKLGCASELLKPWGLVGLARSRSIIISL